MSKLRQTTSASSVMFDKAKLDETLTTGKRSEI